MSSLLSIVLVLALGFAAWVKRDEIRSFLNRHIGGVGETIEVAKADQFGPPQESSSEAALRAERKIIALGRGDESEISMTAEEVDGWVNLRLKGFFPSYVDEVHASIDEDERLVLTGKVAVTQVPGMEGLSTVARFVGDTAPVLVSGRLDGLSPGMGVYYIEQAMIGPLPLPESMRNDLLDQLKGDAAEEMPDGAVAFQLPTFVTDVAVRGGEVHFRRCGDC